MSAIDIPEGTKVNKVMNGGEDTLRIIMELLGKKEFSGYVSIKLKTQNDEVSSYLFVKDSQPTFGIREVISKKKDSDKKVRRVYAGESTVDDVKQDSFDENAKIEIHSGIDVDSIISQYSHEKDESPEEKEEVADSRRVGLFWGGGGDNESLERQVLEEKMKNWESKGYVTSGLEEIFSNDFKDVKAAFDRYEEAVNMLKELGAEIELLSMAGFENEVRNLREKLHDPGKILTIRAEIEALEKLAAEKDTDEAGDNGHKNVCIVCGFPLADEAKCPRCGALTVKKSEDGPKKQIELQSGRCYLIVEDKLDNTMDLFFNMLNKGYKGFGITRTNPRYLKDKGDLKDTKLIWLTDKESTSISTIPPSLERIIYEFGDFVKREEKTVLILDGLEYLVSSNSFDPVLRFIRRIIDDVSESQSVFLVAIGPYTLKPQELKILEREMEKISYID